MTGGDRLDAVAPELLDLLGRTDRALSAYGLPPGHPVVDGLREFRVLPGVLAESIVDTTAGPVLAAADRLTARRSAVLELARPLDSYVRSVAWSGAARESFDRSWAPVAGRLGGCLPATLAATARYGDRLAGWYLGLRAALVDFFVHRGTGPAAATLLSAPDISGYEVAELPERELAGSGRTAVAAADLAAWCFDALRPALAAGTELATDPVNDNAGPVSGSGAVNGAEWVAARRPGAFRAGG